LRVSRMQISMSPAYLGAAMVGAGMAWAFTRYSSDYVGQERAAIGGPARGPQARLQEAMGLAGKEPR